MFLSTVKKSTIVYFILLQTLLFSYVNLPGQTPSADFDIPSSLCINESFGLINSSADADSYFWDFCPESFLSTPAAENLGVISNLNSSFELQTAEDGGSNYTFLTSSAGNNLIRINWQDSVGSGFTETDLGDLTGAINAPRTIAIHREAGNWFAIIGNSTGTIYRLFFGASLNNIPTVESLGDFGILDLRASEFINEGSNKYLAIVGGGNSGQLLMLNFGNSLTNVPSSATYSIAAVRFPSGFDLVESGDDHFGLIGGAGSNLHHVAIEGDPMSATVTVSTVSGVGRSAGLSIVRDLNDYYGFVTTTTGNLFRVAFGTDITNNSTVNDNLGSFSGNLTVNIGFEIVKAKGYYSAIYTGFSNNQFGILRFPKECDVNILTFTGQTPPSLNYWTAGVYNVLLEAKNSLSNSLDTVYKSTTVETGVAPDIDFMIADSRCVSKPILFTAINNSGNIASYSWDFDGNNTVDSTEPAPSFMYSSVGTYDVSLTVESIEGCENIVSKSITILPTPIQPTDFEISEGALCTNTELKFDYDIEPALDGIATYLWDFNSEGSSSIKNPSFTFTTSGLKTINFQVIIPGCTTTVYSEVIEVNEGPSPSLVYTNNCFGEEIQFTDTSEGSTGNTWDFGDGSPVQNDVSAPTHLYENPGNYIVTLTSRNAAGCETELMREITISDLPLADFTFDQAIENLPVVFTGVDETILDNEVISWRWDFGGLGFSTLQNPNFTFSKSGEYNIDLTVNTSQGCVDLISKIVTIRKAICPTIFLDLTDTVCINERVQTVNETVNADRLIWDFCPESFLNDANVSRLGEISGLSEPFETKTISDDANYTFVTSSFSSGLLRIDWEDTIGGNFTVNDLGDFSGRLESPRSIELFKENNIWYGLVGDALGNVYRLDFGTNISNLPTLTLLGNYGIIDLRASVILRDVMDISVIFAGGGDSGELLVLTFDSATDLSPLVTTYAISSVRFPSGLALVEESGKVYGLISGAGNNLFHVEIAGGLSSGEITLTTLSVGRSAGVEIIKGISNYYAFVTTTASGEIFRLNFGKSLANVNPVIENLGNYNGAIRTSIGFEFIKVEGYYFGIVTSLINNTLSVLEFAKNCNLGTNVFIGTTPGELIYLEEGNHLLSVEAINTKSNCSVFYSDSVYVRGSIAPDIDFTIDASRCISNISQFTSINTSGDIVSYSWDFDGDGIEDSAEPNPEFQYLDAGTYNVSLNVDSDGCSNSFNQSITIYPEPANPSFEILGANFCIGDEITFNNLSDQTGIEDVVSYFWDFNGDASSEIENPVFSFETSGTKEISLQAIIPGCTTEVFSRQLIVNAPPEVDFDFTRVCSGLQTTLINVSASTNIVSYFWDFSDGFTSIIENPQHAFESDGSYAVTFTVTDVNGCTNTIIKNVEVGQIPEPEITITGDLACSETVLQFNDVTDNSVSNIISWDWQIEGVGSSAETNPEFTFLESGEYPLSLIIENDFGCVATLDSLITIISSPVANFSVQTSCVGEVTRFFDETPGNVESWFWNINGEEFFTANPEVQFDAAGIYNVSLEVTADNFCVASAEQTFEILATPIADFTFSSNCTQEQIRFEDNSQVFNDPVVSRVWDFGDNTSANGLIAFHQYGESGEYNVTLTLATQNGCEINQTRQIVINESPVSGFEVVQDFGIPPFIVEITDRSSNGNQVDWFLDDQFIAVSNPENPAIPIAEAGLFNIKQVVTNGFGCRDSSDVTILSGLPAYDLILTDFEVIENNSNSTFVISVLNNSNLPVADFDINISLDNQFIVNEKYNGVVRQGVQVVHTLNTTLPRQNLGFVCISVSSPLADFPDINLENNGDCRNISNKIEVSESFPNPSSEFSEIDIVFDEPRAFNFILTDLSGNILKDISFKEKEADLKKIRIDLRILSKGIYLAVFDFDGEKIVRRVIKN